MMVALHTSSKQHQLEDGPQKWRVAEEAVETLQDGSEPPRLIDIKQSTAAEAAAAADSIELGADTLIREQQ